MANNWLYGCVQSGPSAAHKLARIFYRLWTSGDAWVDPGMTAYEHQHRERVVKNLKKKAQALGFDLIAQPTSQECVS